MSKRKKTPKKRHILTTLWGFFLVKDHHTQITAAYLVWERSPDGLVKGGAEELTAVFTEADTCDSFTVSSFKPPQTLTALDLPHLNTHTQSSRSNDQTCTPFAPEAFNSQDPQRTLIFPS